jgi:hypothetical protein
MESGLNFNQLICEFESRRPCQIAQAFVGRSSMAEHRTVTAVCEGSSPFGPPKNIGWQLSIAALSLTGSSQ